jgi:type II secretory pathway component PulF
MSEYVALFFVGLVLVLVGMALLVLARWRSVPGWVLTLLGALAICVFMANVFGFLIWLALLVVLAMAFTHRRVGRRRALLRLLAAATRQQRPLAPAVVAFAQESPGALGRQALRLNVALEAGAPLANALALVGPLMPVRGRSLLYVGQQTNQLTSALEAAADDQEPDNAAGEIMAHLTYLFWLLVFGATILTFVMLKIVPAFRQIFADFGTELPGMTLVLITLSTILAEYWPLVLFSQLALWGAFVYSLLIYVGWIPWRFPLPLDWTRAMETSTALRGLALAAEGNRPLDQGIAALAVASPDYWIRHRLELVSNDVAAGLPWWESLWLRRLIGTADRALLQAAERLGNVPWALRALADRQRWRLTYRLRWALHLLAPPLLVAVGMIVGFVVIALFIPLIKLIETLT